MALAISPFLPILQHCHCSQQPQPETLNSDVALYRQFNLVSSLMPSVNAHLHYPLHLPFWHLKNRSCIFKQKPWVYNNYYVVMYQCNHFHYIVSQGNRAINKNMHVHEVRQQIIEFWSANLKFCVVFCYAIPQAKIIQWILLFFCRVGGSRWWVLWSNRLCKYKLLKLVK